MLLIVMFANVRNIFILCNYFLEKIAKSEVLPVFLPFFPSLLYVIHEAEEA